MQIKKHTLIALSLIILIGTASAATCSSIEQFGITWTFDKEYECGQFANKDYWVIGPVTIVGIDPPSTEIAGRTKNGSMLNVIPLDPNYSAGRQGFDSTANSYYDSNKNVAFNVSVTNPLVVTAGSSLVSMKSIEEVIPKWGQFSDAAILTILSSAPPADSFRPPWIGTDKTVKFNKSNLNYDLLGTLDPSIAGYVPNINSVAALFEMPWIEFWPTAEAVKFFPTNSMEKYGRDISRNIGIGSLILNSNYTNAEKETLMIRFVQLGIDYYAVTQNGDGRYVWHAESGHNPGRKWPILFAGLVLNDNDMKNIGQKSGDYLYSNGYGPNNDMVEYNGSNSNWPPDYIDFGEDGGIFYVKDNDVYAQPYTLVGRPTVTRYETGTVKVTNDSAIVEGINTKWVDDAGENKLQDGYKFGVAGDNRAYLPDGKTYTIESIEDNTHLILTTTYDGNTDLSGTAKYTTASFAAYGHYSSGTRQECIEYEQKHLGLPEFGTGHSIYYRADSLDWLNGPYRSSGTSTSMQGQVLSALIMSAKTLWNHNALFDYEDRYMELMLAEPTIGLHNFQRTSPTNLDGDPLRADYWIEDMWDTYRNQYECVWTRDNPNNTDSQGHMDCSKCIYNCPVGPLPECVDLTALTNYISQWKQGSLSMLSLLQKIEQWKAGTGC